MPDSPLGPFDITPDAVQSLGASFTPFVNRLLDLEVRASGLAGHHLAITSIENRGDGGVDAALRNGVETDFLPAGTSAWQFKRSALSPQECADEFSGAAWANSLVSDGGHYVLVYGTPHGDNLIDPRRQAIVNAAIQANVLTEADAHRIRVYDGNRLARWASRYPSLAVSRLAGGPGSGVADFDHWSGRRGYISTWTPDGARTEAIEAIRGRLTASDILDMRVQGDSGIGKSRLVLEALRLPELQSLVAYVGDERSVDSELLAHLVEDDRTAILVVDDCPAERHVKLVESLPAASSVRLITIGDAGPAQSRVPIISLDGMVAEASDEFLTVNYGQLTAEARRFVVDHSRGNMRWTIVLADRVTSTDSAQAAEVIARNDIVQFVTELLPEGQDFFCSAVLALFERVGWDRELRTQLELLAAFAGLPIEQFERVAADLEQRGLMQRQGRYRTIAPHPLAVFLGAEAWKQLGGRIVAELLPQLTEEMTLSLFRRAADLGSVESVTSALPRLLASDGPFASLEVIESGGLGSALTQLAIVLPDEAALHLGELIEASAGEELQQMSRSRRDLVWTFEKLAWHRRTFASAARSLLRLALAENETWGNNATGTWTALFGAMLPGTAALPAERMDYLRTVVGDSRAEVRLLAVKALARAFQVHESIAVSGEIQGGVLVEPRGRPGTYGELGEYRRNAIELLQALRADEDAAVASAAEKVLLDALQGFIADQFVGGDLADALETFEGDSLRRVRSAAERLLSLYDRHPGDRGENISEHLRRLLDRLPAPSPLEELSVLLHLRQWDLGEGGLEGRIAEVLALVPPEDRDAVFGELSTDLPAAWDLGHALAALDWDGTRSAVLAAHESAPSALLGFMVGLVDAGDQGAFDTLFDSASAPVLSAKERLALSVRGPVTEASRSRIFAAVADLPVVDGVFGLYGWLHQLTVDDVLGLLDGWQARLESQADYNALIDWLALWLHSQGPMPDELATPLLSVLTARRQFPDLGQEEWDWCELGKRVVPTNAADIAHALLELIDSDGVMMIAGDEDAGLLQECIKADPEVVWADIAGRLLAGSWRVQIQVRDWLLHVVPLDLVRPWIGDDIERARLIASIAPVGGEEPTPIARLLLDGFGADEEVSSALSANLLTGSWVGPESLRISGQIEQLTKWRQNTTEPLAVRTWARNMIERLEASRAQVVEREEERGY